MTDASPKPNRKPLALGGAIGLLVGLAIGAGAMAVIDGEDPATTTAKPTTAAITTTAAPSEPEPTVATDSTGAAVPNIGDSALKVGETRHGTAIDTTVLKVKDDYRDGSYQAPDGDARWFGVKAKVCVTAKLDEANELWWSNFEAGNAKGDSFLASSSSWDNFPSPQFPNGTDLQQGCRQGWLLITVPKNAKVDRVRMGSVAEWII